MEESGHLFKGLESRLLPQPGQVSQDGLLDLLQIGQERSFPRQTQGSRFTIAGHDGQRSIKNNT